MRAYTVISVLTIVLSTVYSLDLTRVRRSNIYSSLDQSVDHAINNNNLRKRDEIPSKDLIETDSNLDDNVLKKNDKITHSSLVKRCVNGRCKMLSCKQGCDEGTKCTCSEKRENIEMMNEKKCKASSCSQRKCECGKKNKMTSEQRKCFAADKVEDKREIMDKKNCKSSCFLSDKCNCGRKNKWMNKYSSSVEDSKEESNDIMDMESNGYVNIRQQDERNSAIINNDANMKSVSSRCGCGKKISKSDTGCSCSEKQIEIEKNEKMDKKYSKSSCLSSHNECDCSRKNKLVKEDISSNVESDRSEFVDKKSTNNISIDTDERISAIKIKQNVFSKFNIGYIEDKSEINDKKSSNIIIDRDNGYSVIKNRENTKESSCGCIKKIISKSNNANIKSASSVSSSCGCDKKIIKNSVKGENQAEDDTIKTSRNIMVNDRSYLEANTELKNSVSVNQANKKSSSLSNYTSGNIRSKISDNDESIVNSVRKEENNEMTREEQNKSSKISSYIGSDKRDITLSEANKGMIIASKSGGKINMENEESTSYRKGSNSGMIKSDCQSSNTSNMCLGGKMEISKKNEKKSCSSASAYSLKQSSESKQSEQKAKYNVCG